MKRLLLLLIVALLPAAASAANLVDLRVYDRTTGQELPVYSDGGRRYVAGTPGHEYSIRLRNRAGEDVLAVVSVDGVNAVTGETSAVGQGGYILGAGQRFDIRGWRKSLDEVAAFYFSRQKDSYASRTGRPDELGVIGVAVFRRKVEPPAVEAPKPWRDDAAGKPMKRRESANASSPQPSAAESATDNAQRIGTGHGERESSVVRQVRFERASPVPEQVIAIEYDTRDNLIARGIIARPHHAPQPFPAAFVPDPPRR